jgi:TolB-like protein/tetratricopeptide (TPR) repeat protein
VNRLRSALGDSAETPRFVETVGRRGYRFVASSVAGAPAVPAAAPRLTRLAVLPFRQLSRAPEVEFLSFGLADAIASSLSGLESLSVRSPAVTARHVTGELDLPALAEALDISAVLTGTILHAGHRVRVSTQLIEAPHGTLLWTTTTETPVDDLFQVLDALVGRIVESLALPLTVRDTRLLTQDVPDGHAFSLYLRANELARLANTWNDARNIYLQVVRADPDYAPAWARLGRIYRLMAKYAAESDPQLVRMSEESLRRALAINPELSLAHYMYAQLEMETGRCQEALTRLLGRLHERRSDAQLFAALVQACRYVGLVEASRAAHARARALDPFIRTSIAYTSAMIGEYERALAEARDNDDSIEAHVLAMLGRIDEASAALAALKRQYGSNRLWAAYIECVSALMQNDPATIVKSVDELLRFPFGDPDGLIQMCIALARAGAHQRTLSVLERAVRAGFSCPVALEQEPSFDPIRGDDTFEALLAEVRERHRRASQVFESAGGLGLFSTLAETRLSASEASAATGFNSDR